MNANGARWGADTGTRWLKPDELEAPSRESMDLARLAWNNAPADVGAFDRLQVLLYVGGDLFLDADYSDLIGREFDQLPAGLVYRLEAFIKHAGRFMAHGLRARKAAKLRAVS